MNLAIRLFQRELAAEPRRRRFYLKRMIMPACACAILAWGLLTGLLTQSRSVGLAILAPMFSMTLLVLIPYALVAAGGLIQRERDERTLELLLISDITAWGCVEGKMLSAVFSAMMLLLSVAPICMLGVSLGGVAVSQVLSAFGVLVSTLFFCVCMGLMLGAIAATERVLNGLRLFFGLFYFAVIPVALGILSDIKEMPGIAQALVVISPFKAMADAMAGRNFALVAFSCVFHPLIGLAMLWVAKVSLPLSLGRGEMPGLRFSVRERLKRVRGLRRLYAPGPIRGNPVFWKDWHFFYGGARALLLRLLLPCAILVLVFGTAVPIAGWDAEETLVIMMVLGVSFLLIFFAEAISNLSMCFNREKRNRAIEMLLATSLTTGEILRGKIASALLVAAPWAFFAVLCLLGALFAVMPISADDFLQGAGVLLIVALEGASMALAYGSLAVLLSLRCRRNIGFAVCAAAFFGWNTCGRQMISIPFMLSVSLLSALSPMDPFIILVAFDVLVHLAAAFVCIIVVRRSFRDLALRAAGPA